METMTSSQRWLHRYAVLTACCTFLLVIAGGLVTSTGSGLSVPDWPLSYGQVMPDMVGGIFYEHGHRMIATGVGILTIGLVIWILRAEDRRWVKWLGGAALLAIILQGVLGGLTVLYLLPTPISVLHATIAQSFFSLTIVLALVTSAWWRNAVPAPVSGADRTRKLALLASGIVLLQLVLGAWMRHSDAGLAIPDFPLSYGHLLPPASADGLAAANELRIELGLPPVEASQIWVHFAHRIGALLVLLVLGVLVVHLLRSYPGERSVREPAVVLGVLLLMQIMLGALTVWSGKGVAVATTHVAVGALLLGTTVFLTVRLFRLYPPAQRLPGFSTVAQLSRS